MIPRSLYQQAILRLGGLPASSIERLRDPLLLSRADSLAGAEAAALHQRDRVSTLLHAAVGRSEGQSRSRLVSYRRTVFNEQKPRPAEIAAAETVLTAAERAEVDVLGHLRDEVHIARAALESQWARAQRHARRGLCEVVGNEDFQRGLLISSRTLFGNIAKYRERAPLSDDARLEQIERGLLRYASRTALKATPFGRLCAVAGVSLEVGDATNAGFELTHDPAVKLSAVRLNKTLHAMLWSLLKSRDTRFELPVELTPTLEEEPATYRFLRGVGTMEAFQRMERNEALDLVVQHTRAASGTTIDSLCAALVDDARLDTSLEDARRYLDSLVGAGLLRYNSGIPDQIADWDRPLRDLLATVRHPLAAEMRDLLTQLRAQCDVYTHAGVIERARIGEAITAAIAAFCLSADIRPPRAGELPFYEDAGLPGELRLRLTTEDSETLHALSRYLDATRRLSWLRANLATMRAVLERLHPEPDASLPLLEFYEAYYREHVKPSEEKARRRSPGEPGDVDHDPANPLRLPFVGALRQATGALASLFREAAECHPSPETEEVDIPLESIEEIAAALPADATPFHSASLFLVPAGAPHAPLGRVVVPNASYSTGFGKFFSRFLYLVPDGYAVRLRERNRALGGTALAEISADAFFNANLHPPLTDVRLSYPTGESASGGEELDCHDIEVRRDPQDEHGLVLVRRSSGERVHPLDLGFLNPRMRPPLFQLLAKFAPGSGFGVYGADATTTQADAQPSTVRYRPRVTIGGRIVASRRQWIVPRDAFPARLPNETEVAYFARLTAWRRSHQIPDEVYARVIVMQAERPPRAQPDEGAPREPTVAETPARGEQRPDGVDAGGAPAPGGVLAPARPAVAAGGAGEQQRRSRDYAKPQYLDFANPLFVKLFSKMPTGLHAYRIILEERYPEGSSLPRYGNEPYTVEMLLQFDWGREEAAPHGDR